MKKAAKRQEGREEFMKSANIEIYGKDGKQILVDRIQRFSPNSQERNPPQGREKGLGGCEDPTRLKVREVR